MSGETYAQFGIAGFAFLVVWKIIVEMLPKALSPVVDKLETVATLLREVVASNAKTSERIARVEARLQTLSDFDDEPTPVDNPRQRPGAQGFYSQIRQPKARDG